jgi:hypothetical protein
MKRKTKWTAWTKRRQNLNEISMRWALVFQRDKRFETCLDNLPKQGPPSLLLLLCQNLRMLTPHSHNLRNFHFSKSMFMKRKRKFVLKWRNRSEKSKETLRYFNFYCFVAVTDRGFVFEVVVWPLTKWVSLLQMTRDELQEMTSKRDELESVVKK